MGYRSSVIMYDAEAVRNCLLGENMSYRSGEYCLSFGVIIDISQTMIGELMPYGHLTDISGSRRCEDYFGRDLGDLYLQRIFC